MLSVNAISSSNAALAALRQTNADIASTQKRIASGLRVASAADDSVVWATAQGIRSDMAKEASVSAGLANAKGRGNLTLEALNKISDILTSMKTITDQTVVSAAANDSDDVANTARSAQLDSYQAQLDAITKSVTFQGANWLQDSASSSIVLSTSGGSDVTYSFTPTQMYASNGSAGSLKAAIDLTTTGALDTAAVAAKKAVVTAAITAVTNYIQTVKGVVDVVTKQQDFLATMSDIRKEALSNLVDADMTEESARIQSLQVKQQLAYQALAIGNSSSQNILRLFQ